jgi:hypothetical protein
MFNINPQNQMSSSTEIFQDNGKKKEKIKRFPFTLYVREENLTNIDVSSLKIVEFLESTLTGSRYPINFISNCDNLKELDVVLCGEFHKNYFISLYNHLVIKVLLTNQINDRTICLEGDIQKLKKINPQETMQLEKIANLKNWDSVDASSGAENITMLALKAGLFLEKLIHGIDKKEIPNETLKEREEKLSKIYLYISNEVQKAKANFNILNFSLLSNKLEAEKGNTFQELLLETLKQVEILVNLYNLLFQDSITRKHEQRQVSLVNTIKNSIKHKDTSLDIFNPVCFIAGIYHLIDENSYMSSQSKIENILKEGLMSVPKPSMASKKIKFLIVSPLIFQGPNLSQLSISDLCASPLTLFSKEEYFYKKSKKVGSFECSPIEIENNLQGLLIEAIVKYSNKFNATPLLKNPL